MKKQYILFIMAIATFLASCNNEEVDASFITNVVPFTITSAPTEVIVTSEDEHPTITIEFELSAEQIIETVVGVYVDESSTATEGEDFTLSTNEVDVAAFQRRGSFTVSIIADIDIEDDSETLVLRLGSVPTDVAAWSPSNEVLVTIQINDDHTYKLDLITDWEYDKLVGVPSINGGDPTPIYTICGNGVDLDPYAFNEDFSFFTYSDNYGACPEQFSDLNEWPDDTYFFEIENFSNVFGNFPDAIGDLCIRSTFQRFEGESFVFDQIPSTCWDVTDLGYFDAGGEYAVKPLMTLVKENNVYQVFEPVNDTQVGIFGRQTQGPLSALHQELIRQKKENYTAVTVDEIR